MPAAAFAAKQQQERDAGAAGTFFTLVCTEQAAPAGDWFGGRGWASETTALPVFLEELGRPIPADDPEAGPMAASISLVTAIKG